MADRVPADGHGFAERVERAWPRLWDAMGDDSTDVQWCRETTVAVLRAAEGPAGNALDRAAQAEAEAASYREALEELASLLDLSDEHTLEQAKPGELIACTRPKETWIAARAALSRRHTEEGEAA